MISTSWPRAGDHLTEEKVAGRRLSQLDYIATMIAAPRKTLRLGFNSRLGLR
jgi:hypothetical protein